MAMLLFSGRNLSIARVSAVIQKLSGSETDETDLPDFFGSIRSIR
jgi:hypothetical protein